MVEEDKIFILAAKDSEEDGTNRKGPESYLVLDFRGLGYIILQNLSHYCLKPKL